ncbi:MAG: hypothetical protein EHM45_01625 [Desulfobacteraceae bacterium]|nr:MAG: hypothetical protein EHM45_01625 [Desulfobacteraceae bacterium]
MKIEQKKWLPAKGWKPSPPGEWTQTAQLVLVFGSASNLMNQELMKTIQKAYPKACVFGCSTAGEIFDTQVSDDSLSLTAVHFEHTPIQCILAQARDLKNSYHAGEYLAGLLEKKGLVHVFVLSDGINMNGSELVAGLTDHFPPEVTITGGLSGDGADFKETFVFLNGPPQSGAVAAIGLYGKRIKVGFGSLGGWDPFGPERLITRSQGNILYELDHKSALELYKIYLGDHARDLPASGLLFPLSIRTREQDSGLVRTILAIDEKRQSLIFAGDVPEGAYARLMKANFDRLIDGAIGAAKISYEAVGRSSPDLAVLISCVGRKMVLKQRVEEEVEGVLEVLGHRTALTGFYSYGEIAPFTPGGKCVLHNQTMTVTTLSE